MAGDDRLVFEALEASRERSALRFVSRPTEVELTDDTLSWRPHGHEARTLRLDGLEQVVFLDSGDGSGSFVARTTTGAPVELPVRWRLDADEGLPARARALAHRATARARDVSGATGVLSWDPDEPLFRTRLQERPAVRIVREDLDGLVIAAPGYPGWAHGLLLGGAAMFGVSLCAGAVNAWAVPALVLVGIGMIVASFSIRSDVTVTLRQAGLTVEQGRAVDIPYATLDRVDIEEPDGETAGGVSRIGLRFVRTDGSSHTVAVGTGGMGYPSPRDVERLVAQIGWMAGRTSRAQEAPEALQALRRGRATEGQSR